MNHQKRTLGAYVNFEQLASYHLFAKQLPLKRNHRAFSQLSGPFKTLIRGRGLEFEDVRIYQPGDDIRSIDWRVSARTGVTHTKQFQEEKERPVIIVADQRQNMFFGSQKAMKSVLAADIASMIAWAAFHKGDRVGGLVFNDETHQDIRPLRQRKNILKFIHHLVEYNQQLKSFKQASHISISDMLIEIKRVAKPGTQIYFISDFHDLKESDQSLLHNISRHCEFMAIKPFDKLEFDLPKKGQFRASDGSFNILFNAANKKTRENYQSVFIQQANELKKILGRYMIPLISIDTGTEPLDVLQHYFSQISSQTEVSPSLAPWENN